MSVAIINSLTESDDEYFSGDDPPCVCDVQSVEDHPGCSPSDVYPGGCHAHHLQQHQSQSKQWYRYVSDTVGRSTPYLRKSACTVSIVQLFDIAVCGGAVGTERCGVLCMAIQFTLGAVMCVFVTAKFVGDSLRMYRATGKLQLNRYMSLLVRDGLLYFIVYVPSSCSLSCVNSLNNMP